MNLSGIFKELTHIPATVLLQYPKKVKLKL